MRARLLILLLLPFMTMLATACSEFATEAAQSGGFTATDINGTWRHAASGITIRISGVGASKAGSGQLLNAGSVYPSGAVGGDVLRVVEHQSGGYWDAYHYQYQTNGQWVNTHIVGLAMESDKRSFLIGSAVYTKQ